MNTTPVIPLVLHRLVRGRPSTFEEVGIDTFEYLVEQIAERSALIDGHAAADDGSMRYIITFDDGFASDVELALPILAKHRVAAVFFPVTAWIGRAGHLSWNELQDLRGAGMQIGSHSTTHLSLVDLPPDAARQELVCSRAALEDSLGEPILAFAFPYGAANNRTIAMAFDAGYRICCTSGHGVAQLPATMLPRNSINSRTRRKDIDDILAATARTRLRWLVEDICKSLIKSGFGRRRYRLIRAKILRRG